MQVYDWQIKVRVEVAGGSLLTVCIDDDKKISVAEVTIRESNFTKAKGRSHMAGMLPV